MIYLWYCNCCCRFNDNKPSSLLSVFGCKLVSIVNDLDLFCKYSQQHDAVRIIQLNYHGDLHLSRQRAVKSQRRNSIMTQQENTIRFDQAKPTKQRSIEIVPRSRNQERLVLALQSADQHIVVTAGPAGTGKTYLAMLAAVKALRNGEVDRIVLTRPAVGVEDEKHGFLPGDLNQKMDPWVRPLTDILREYYRAQDIADMIQEQKIEIAPLAFMRGRTFKSSYIIADEMQNATPSQCKMLMTRIGEDSKIVITGDVEQADRNRGNNGLIDLCQRLQEGGVKGIAVCHLDNQDIQRHKIIASVLNLYAD
jgi:phosphate starvation-inducible protein PhoH